MEEPASIARSGSRWRRRLSRLAIAVVTLYALGCGGLYLGQDAILFPGHRWQGNADTAAWFDPKAERVDLKTADGTALVARYRPADDAKNAPTVLFFYGNAMCAAWCDPIAQMLGDLGCNVLIADYPGYGQSGGKPSEAGCYATADAAWKYLRQDRGIAADRIVVMGWSLGSAVALDLASRETPAGLITLSAFTSVPDVARANYPLVPVGSIVRSQFDNLSKVPNVKCPVLLFHGKLDTLIAPSNADKLVAAFGSQAELVWLPRADHNTMFEAEPTTLNQSLRRFLSRVTSGPLSRVPTGEG